MKGLCRRAKAGSSREMMDFLFDDRRALRNHEKAEVEVVEEEDDGLVRRLLVLFPLLPLLSLLVGVDVLVVEEDDDDDDDEVVVSLFPELAVDCLRLLNFHLPRLMMTILVFRSLGYDM